MAQDDGLGAPEGADDPAAGDRAQEEVAPDGSPVAFYRRLPATGEPELIHATVPLGASILDLGCGPGRIAGPLVELGHPVTGIDDGAAMVDALPPGVVGIVGDARLVRLGRRFDAVLLASHLVNATGGDAEAFLATAAAHLAPGGVVIGETFAPGSDPTAGVGKVGRLGDAEIVLLSARVAGDRLDAVVRYGVDGRTWSQPFSARLLDETALRALLAGAGLGFDRWLDRPGWFTAVAVESLPAGPESAPVRADPPTGPALH